MRTNPILIRTRPVVQGSNTHSAFELLYMILYIGGGHTEVLAVLAFVSFQ